LGSHDSDRNNSATINLVGTIVLPPMTADGHHLMVPPAELFFIRKSALASFETLRRTGDLPKVNVMISALNPASGEYNSP
jgi:hypothetical protein